MEKDHAAQLHKQETALSPKIAKQLLQIRDALIACNYDEAYHILCLIADPELAKQNHWEDIENTARNVWLPYRN